MEPNTTSKKPEQIVGSKRFNLDKNDSWKILKGLLIAVAGGALLAGISWLEALPEQINFGMYEAIAISVITTVVNALRKFSANYSDTIVLKEKK